MESQVVRFLARKERGKSLMNPQKKLLRKMHLMERKVSSAFIVINMSTYGGNVMISRYDSLRRVMTLFPLLMIHSLLIFL
jgi:hypothetical protein